MPKKIRYHWGGDWERVGDPFFYEYVGGSFVDKMTTPKANVNDIIEFFRHVADVEGGYWFLYSLVHRIRSTITDDLSLKSWWATSEAEADGCIHLYVTFYPDKVHPNDSPCRRRTCRFLCQGNRPRIEYDEDDEYDDFDRTVPRWTHAPDNAPPQNPEGIVFFMHITDVDPIIVIQILFYDFYAEVFVEEDPTTVNLDDIPADVILECQYKFS